MLNKICPKIVHVLSDQNLIVLNLDTINLMWGLRLLTFPNYSHFKPHHSTL